MIAEPNRKRKYSPSFLARAQPMKSRGLFVYYSPPNFLLLFIKNVLFLCPAGTCTWLPMVADPEWQFSADPIFAGKISGSLFVSGQHFGALYRHQGRLRMAPEQVSKHVWYPQLSPLSLTAFLANLKVWRYIFLLGLSLCPLCIWSSPAFTRDPFLSFWLRPCSVCKNSLGTSVWFGIRLFD